MPKKFIGGMSLFAALLAVSVVAEAAPAERLTFTKDILPILQENCVRCHRTGGDNIAGMIAPMSLTSYQEVRPWAKAIAKAVSSRKMPPWFADDKTHGVFKNERTLGDEDIETIVAWTQSGVARGNPKDAPTPVTFQSSNGWLTGEPDLVVRLPEAYFVEDDVDDLYVSFVTEPISRENLPETTWLRSIEWRGDSDVVHHIVGSASVEGEKTASGFPRRNSLGSIAPGEEGTNFPEGYGKLLDADSKIHFSMHYHKEAGPGTGKYDQSMVGFRFWDKDKDPAIVHPVSRNGISHRSFEIPPGHGNWEVGASKTFDVDTTILSLHPHMHLRGKDAEYIAYYPDGTQETLVTVPKFDFNWQLDYFYDEPKQVPAGTRVEFTVHYDNSTANEYNPDHTIPMSWGGPTTSEMMIGYISYTGTEPVDPAADDSTD
ncbi:MAG TPA: cytochrome c [Candidatus Hydrogenedentes bacterium]|nr:cytochrome c [Candidatus Hydrogenedentota bacterium]